MPQYRIIKVEQNQFDKEHTPFDPKALYSWEVSRIGSNWKVGSGCNYEELEPILKFYGLTRPAELAGLTFGAQVANADSALDWLRLECQNGGDYHPPAEEEILNRAVEALAKFEVPDYSDVDGGTVSKFFMPTFHSFTLDEEWFKNLCRMVEEKSGGAVSIEKANRDEFTLLIHGPAEYLYLVRGEERKRVIFGPYSTPFSFDPDKDEYERRMVAAGLKYR